MAASGNGNPVDYVGDFTDQGHNIVNNNNPGLAPLANNGGLTQTHALLCGSPAIDAGDPNNIVATDQRGIARPQGSGVDIGAFELPGLCSVTVNSYGDNGYGTFREALDNVASSGTVNISPGLSFILLSTGPLVISKNVTVNVSPANPVTVYGNNTFNLLTVNSGATVNLTRLNLTGGNGGGNGGAIQNSGTLNASYLVIYDNAGGGIGNFWHAQSDEINSERQQRRARRRDLRRHAVDPRFDHQGQHRGRRP